MVHPTAVLGDDVVLEADVDIGPFVVIGDRVHVGAGSRIDAHAVIGSDCTVGADARIGAQAVLYPDVHLGDGAQIASGACIGSDGFGFAWDGSGFRKIPQVGGCRIGAGFHAAENATVDRGSIGPTRLGEDVVLGPLSHIGHNARLGDRVSADALCGIAGSATIGADTTFAQQSATVGHVHIGESVQLEPWGGITQSVPAGARLSGVPARDVDEVARAEDLLDGLPALVKRINTLLRAAAGGKEDSDAVDHGR